MYLHFFNSFLVFMIVGLVGEAVVIAKVFRLLIPPLFLSPDNTSVGANYSSFCGRLELTYFYFVSLVQYE